MNSTPVKNEVFSPHPSISKFEDSPVFNYINDLSPIKPLTSSGTGRSFHLLGFTSPRSSMTSTGINCSHDSKIIGDHDLLCPPKAGSSDVRTEGSRFQTTSGDAQPEEIHTDKVEHLDTTRPKTDNAATQQSELSHKLGQCMANNDESSASITTNPPDAHRNLILELPHSVVHDHGLSQGSYYNAMKHCCSSKISDLETHSPLLFEDISTNKKGYRAQLGPIREVKVANEWDKLLFEASDQLLCNSEEGHNQEFDSSRVDPGMLSFIDNIFQLSQDDTEEAHKAGPLLDYLSDKQGVDLPTAHVPETGKPFETGQASTCDQSTDITAPTTIIEVKKFQNQQQMIRRRCLVFEMSGTRIMKVMSETSENRLPSEKSAFSDGASEVRSFSSQPETGNFPAVVPGIGLHLNALATSGKDKRLVVKQESVKPKRQLASTPSTIPASPCSIGSDQNTVGVQMNLDPSVKELLAGTEQVNVAENVTQSLELEVGEKLEQSSNKRKRPKSDNAGDGESCKRCNCKRSKCLKLYCECFAAGLYCVEPCSCQGCFNKPAYEDTVLETRRLIEARNPLAFAPKVIKVADVPEHGDEPISTPASARHKRGCNCKKSGCLKKYCECFQGGVGCSFSCRCENCKNSFGRKHGTFGAVYEDTASDNRSINASVPVKVDMVHQNPQITPFTQISRGPWGSLGLASPKMSLASTSVLQRSTSHRQEKPSSVSSQNLEKSFDEDASLDVSKDDNNSIATETSVKSTSPTSKRVSPPDCATRKSPVRRFCRKLILRSIPSFPPLPHKNDAGDSNGNPT